tara:strand:+ start:7821 stop:8156 length:336 start_codon:yes stop_codon:yes gene_type:complete
MTNSNEVTSITEKYTTPFAIWCFEKYGTGSSESALLNFWKKSDPDRKVRIVNEFKDVFGKYAEGSAFDNETIRREYQEHLAAEKDIASSFFTGMKSVAEYHAKLLINKEKC